MMLLPLAGRLVILFRMETEITGWEIVKPSVSETELFATEVAVMVG